MSLTLQGARFARLKYGSQANVAVVGPTGELKVWLTIACALNISFKQFIPPF